MKPRYTRYVPYIFAAVCTLIYISLVFNDNVWMDEAFSASIIRCDLAEMVSRTFADTLPPFYNFSAWIFTRIFGFSTVSLKIFSVIPVVLLMAVSSCVIPRIASVRSACFYIVLLTTMPHLLEYGVEIRMYSWALSFASLTAISALCLLQDAGHAKLWLVICTVAGAYTHQYALIAESFIWLMLLVIYIRRKSFLQWLIPAAICILCYIPCAVLTVYQMKAASSYFSASPPTLDNLLSVIRFPFVTNVTLLSALLLTGAVALFIYSCMKGEYINAYLMTIYVFIALLSFILMRLSGSSFFSARYLLPAIGLLHLGAALALGSLTGSLPAQKKAVYMVSIPLILMTLIIIYVQQFRSEYTDITAFKQFIESTDAGDGYVMIEDFPEVEICLDYYAPWLKSCTFDDISHIQGDKYVIVNDKAAPEDKKNLKKFDLRYVEDLDFDRYKIKVYILLNERE